MATMTIHPAPKAPTLTNQERHIVSKKAESPMKSTTSTIERHTVTAAPVNPAATVTSPAVQRLQDARRVVQEAKDTVAVAQDAASAPTLRQHEVEVLHTFGVYQDGDPALLAATEAGTQARQLLTKARVVLHRAEQEQTLAEEQVAVAGAAGDLAWRRTWVLAHHPELLARLSNAQADQAALQANPYSGSSTQGLADIRFAQARIVAVEEAIGRVAKQAPGLGNGVDLPADWTNRTPEEQRAWVLQADGLATLAAG